MEEHDPGAYGRHLAEDYDDVTALLEPTTADAVATLVDLAEGGSVVEFGVGTGRLALPLRERGVEVAGIESSEEMIAELHAKPGGRDLHIEAGDFTATRVPGEHALVVLAYNTVYALPTQDAQVACFANAAAHLRPGGRFVVDAWVPDPAAFHRGQAVRALAVREDVVVLEVAHLDSAHQRMRTTKIRLRDGDVDLFPANHRYAWPAELDLMARLAGMKLEHRWGSWQRTPFSSGDARHVSVYRRAVPEPA